MLAELTDRECDILVLVTRGLSNEEIAGRLVISPLNAKTHARNIPRATTAPGSWRSPKRAGLSPRRRAAATTVTRWPPLDRTGAGLSRAGVLAWAQFPQPIVL